MKKLLRSLLVGALLASGALLPLHSSQAATFTVSKLADTNDGTCDADCSLREAIHAANTAVGDDVIQFAGNVRGAIDLTSTLPNLHTNISIQGPGAKLLTVRRSTAEGTPNFRALNSNAVVSLSGLTFSNGRITGIGDDGYAGAIGAGNYGMLTIQDCVFSHNTGVNGGAIFNGGGGTLLIYNSTFTNNVAVAGAALMNQPQGSGSNAHTLISQCTFSGNTATKYMGGAILNMMPLAIEHSTFSGNSAPTGAGIHTLWPMSIEHTILANNGTNLEIEDGMDAQITSLGYNLANDDGGGFLTGPGDLLNTDPMLFPLGNYGGPTPTHALRFGSPAINAGNPAFAPPPDFDQRGSGFPRVRNGRLDIGAYEYEMPLALTINDVTMTEGNSGETNTTFEVRLTIPSTQTVTVNAIPYNGSAKAPADYTSGGARLVFAPGETSKTFSVPIKGDVLDETNEVFYVVLSSPVNAVVARGRGIGTIQDDDRAPALTIGDVSIIEGNSGVKMLTFTASLSAISGQNVSVNYASANGSAQAGSDYLAKSGTLTFTPGQIARTISITINGDTVVEGNEAFYVLLSGATNASIGRGRAIGTIQNDDTSG